MKTRGALAATKAGALPEGRTAGGRSTKIPSLPDDQVDRALEILQPLVEAVGATLGPHCEVVLHDLRTPERSITAIANGTVTGRRVGGPVVGGPLKDVALKLLDSTTRESTMSIGYQTHTRDGRDLRSTSLILRTSEGKPAIAFCINIDLSTITMARLLLEELSKTEASDGTEAPDASPQIDVTDITAQIIRDALGETGKLPKYMERDDRLKAVSLMQERGLFLIRGGVERAAAALGISRFTLYSYLKEVRG